MPFSYFISCLWWICVVVHEWVYAASFGLFYCPSHSLYSAQTAKTKLRRTKSWRAIKTEKRRKIMSNYVKLKWHNLQNDLHFSVVFFSCHFLVCLRERNKDQLCETIPLKPTICPSIPSLMLLACQSKTLIIAMETEGLVTSSNKISEQQFIRKSLAGGKSLLYFQS